MARKKTAKKKVTKTARARRKTAKPAAKPRKAASKATVGPRGAIDLLRGWSPSRYSSR
jgi:hypothetical protein